MEITPKEIKISAIALGYADNNEDGVVGYGGNLNIRPPYQREFVYKDKQRDAVIDTIMRGFPLNVMYWAKNEDGTYEVLDGQQRTISFCEFVENKFTITDKNGKAFSFESLTEYEKNQILDYKVMVYICEGNDKERLDWFRTINIAGERLTDQELLNINYTGEWLSHAKKLFSKTNCFAETAGRLKQRDNKTLLISGSAIRQDYLETALSWISGGKEKISEYMAKHCKDSNANELKTYFEKVIEWVKNLFPEYRKEMKGIDWGRLYREYGNETYDVKELERQVSSLMADEEVTNTKGIYEYVLSRGTKNTLSLRTFSQTLKEQMYRKQGGFCPITRKKLDLKDMDAHHIDAWENSGKTIIENGVLLERTAHNKLHTECTHKPFEVREMRDKLIEDVKNGIM